MVSHRAERFLGLRLSRQRGDLEAGVDDVGRRLQVDGPDEVLLFGGQAEFFDHLVGQVIDLAEEVVDPQSLERRHQVFDLEASEVSSVEETVIVRNVAVVKPEQKLHRLL